MGLTDRWRTRRTEQQVTPEPERLAALRPMTAAGRRVDLSSPSPALLRRKDWQTAAWGYRDTVPELRFTVGFIAQALGRLRVFPAVNQPEGREPLPLDDAGTDGISARTAAAARDAIERINLDVRGSSMLARLGENLEVAAEGYLLGEPDMESPTGESWSVRSITEISISNDGKIRLTEPGARSTAAGGRELDPTQVELLRVWRPHPQFYDWPDSEMAAVLDTAEELRLIDRLMRASTRSRISSGQILFIPDELSLSRPGTAPVSAALPGSDEDEDPFQEELVSAFIEPIQNEDAPEAVVPILMRGPGVMKDHPTKDLMGTVAIPREDPAELNARRDQKVAVLARALNIPPEVMTGLSVGNHWSSWLISADTVRNHIEPRAEVLVDSLTSAYLRPMLREMGCPPEEAARVCLWFDPSELVQNPNRGQDARDAHGARVLSDEALNRYLGFSEDDYPGLNERLFRALEARAISDQQVPLMLALAGVGENDPIMRAAVAAAKVATPQQAPRVINAPQDRAPARGLPSGEPPSNPGPPPRPVNASAAPVSAPRRTDTLRVPDRLSGELARIDQQLLLELLTHADATVGRAVERAANRVRARAQRDPQMAAAFRGRSAVTVCAELGDQLAAFTEEDDVQDATSGMQTLFLAATAAAAIATAEIVGTMLQTGFVQGLADRLTAAARDVWPRVDQQLRQLMRDVLAGRAQPPANGESHGLRVPPALLRGALAQAGGLPPGSPGVTDRGSAVRAAGGEPLPGLATGEHVGQELRSSGGASLGYEWQYFGIMRVHFPPHRALSGRRFSGWQDEVLATLPEHRGWIGSHYSPGDHDGCLCGFYPIWAVPKDPDEPRARADASSLTERTSQVESRILMAEVDDQHPPRGTLPDGRTHAQAARDLHEELVRLRQTHINERETP